ncbi:MAG: APC family permease [Propionibacteriaceae bacterium]|nr:APC family permease [Propionibacteriaceae bacterium]
MTQLARRLTLADAVVIGLGSMIGTGVFVVWGPAAAAAGSALFVGLALAALVAYCNATSSAQLAAAYPTSGGTYVYGREVLGPWWGHVAGWGFVIGKTASAAAMALTVAVHLTPPGWWQRPVAAATVLALVAVNYHGITRTARLARLIVSVVLVVLGWAVVVMISGWTPDAWVSLGSGPAGPASPADAPAAAYGVLQAAGLLFFAFAGYARIATLGEEVVAPRTTIPRAILIALGLVVALYALVGVAVTGALGADALASSTTPVADAVRGTGPVGQGVLRLGAAIASLGALLALVAGIGRTTLAMARNGDLPRPLAAVHPRHQVPHVAEVTVGVVVALVVLVADLRGVIGFSSFGVLTYYFVANRAAWAQTEGRLYGRWLQALGMALCAALVLTLPWQSVVVGLVVVAVGVGYRLAAQRAAGGTSSSE